MTYKFLLECINARKKTLINDDIKCLINFEEKPCYLENPTKESMDIKGKKLIKTY